MNDNDEKSYKRLHDKSFVIDGHCDTVLSLVREERDLAEESNKGHIDLPRLRRGGVNVQFFAHYIAPQYKPELALKQCLKLMTVTHEQIEDNEELMLVETKGDLRRLNEERDQIGLLLSIEGAEAIAGEPALLSIYHRLGIRSVGLTWNQRNALADGVGVGSSAGGLTKAGKRAVRMMNQLGIIVDVAHLSKPSFWDTIEVTEQPIIASHANARALCDHQRNLTDRQIEAIAETGGLVGVVFCPPFISEEAASVSKVVDHVEYIAELVGAEHVGLGSDFDGIGTTPRGLEDVSQLPNFTKELLGRGFAEEEIKGILGHNHLRVMEEVFVV